MTVGLSLRVPWATQAREARTQGFAVQVDPSLRGRCPPWDVHCVPTLRQLAGLIPNLIAAVTQITQLIQKIAGALPQLASAVWKLAGGVWRLAGGLPRTCQRAARPRERADHFHERLAASREQ